MRSLFRIFRKPLTGDWLWWLFLLLWAWNGWVVTRDYYGGSIPLGSPGGLVAWPIDMLVASLAGFLFAVPIGVARNVMQRRRATREVVEGEQTGESA